MNRPLAHRIIPRVSLAGPREAKVDLEEDLMGEGEAPSGRDGELPEGGLSSEA